MNKLILIGLFSLTFVSCDKNISQINRIYENRDNLLQIFENVDIIERSDAIYFVIHSEYCDTLENNYHFIRENGSISLVTSRLGFELNEISISNSSQKYGVKDYLNLCLEKMQTYKIKGVGASFRHMGITTTFYLRDALVMYISDKTKVTNESWINCIEKSNKLDECWYWISLDDYNNIPK